MSLSPLKIKFSGQIRIDRNSSNQWEVYSGNSKHSGELRSPRLSYKGNSEDMMHSMKIKQCYDLAQSFRALNFGCIQAQNYKILKGKEIIKKKKEKENKRKVKKQSEAQFIEFMQDKRRLQRILLVKGKEKTKVLSQVVCKDIRKKSTQRQSINIEYSLQKFSHLKKLKQYHTKENNCFNQRLSAVQELKIQARNNKPEGRVKRSHILAAINQDKISLSKNGNQESLKQLISEEINSLSSYRFQEPNVFAFQQSNGTELESASKSCLQLQNKVIKAIYEGNYFGVEIQLSLTPSLLTIKQKGTKNNLLHLCVLNNNQDLFQMILQKSMQTKVNLLSAVNKYGRTPVELGKIISFFKKKSLVGLLAEIEQKIARGLLKKVFYSS